MYLSLYCKGSKRVTQGFTVRGSWRPNKDCNILTPTLMAVSIVSFLFSRAAQPEAQLSAECWLSLTHLVSNGSPKLLGAPRAPSAGCSFPYHILSPTSLIPNSSVPQGPPPPGFLYHILSTTSLDPNSIRGPFGLVWLSLPHLISNSNCLCLDRVI